jgi:hypothetical protein
MYPNQWANFLTAAYCRNLTFYKVVQYNIRSGVYSYGSHGLCFPLEIYIYDKQEVLNEESFHKLKSTYIPKYGNRRIFPEIDL